MRLSAPVYQLKRRAKLLARKEKIPMHEALNRIARAEGFAAWSLLAAQLAARSPSKAVLAGLSDGDTVLIGARPGHGKTMLGLNLLLDAVAEGRKAVFFTLEYTEAQARAHIRSLDADAPDDALEIVTSSEIAADFITAHLAGSPSGTVAVVDYLQVLDQQRSKPALGDQMRSLRAFARESGVILGFLSQIDRAFSGAHDQLPGIRDVRLPNPIPPETFSKTCFLHDGEIQVQATG
jgi:replicative DNA helicase